MKLGYTDFINKHKTIFFSIFVAFFIFYFVIPIVFIDLSKYDNLSVRDNTLFTFAPIYLCIRCFNTDKMISSRYEELSPFINRSYKEFYASTLKNYADGIIGMIFTILILASIIYLIVRYIKTKSISRLVFIPYCLAILNNIVIIITYRVLESTISFVPLNLIITLLFSVPVLLYCFKFQRFPAREHKPTDKERIAELEKRITELEGKDAE